MNPAPPAIDMRGICKQYDQVLASNNIDLTVHPGELHAIVGENGAGKTTLMNILCGLVSPDTGEICVHGNHLPPGSPSASLDAGIGLVAQHFSLVPTLTAWENIILGREPGNRGLLNRRLAREQTRELAHRLGLSFPLDAPVETLPLGTRQGIEILKALYRNARILVLDEPTSALSPPEAERLFEQVQHLRERGTTVLLITHRIREVQDHATRATVLRQGRLVRTFEQNEIDPDALVHAIVGHPQTSSTPRATPPLTAPCLQIQNLKVHPNRPVGRSLDLTVYRGELLGLAGVSGNGQKELAAALLGRLPVPTGTIHFNGQDISRLSISARRTAGLAYISEDRDQEGLIPALSLRDNLLLDNQRQYNSFRGLDFQAMDRRAQELITDYDIRAADLLQPVAHLSGGNRQKTVVARELARSPDFVLAVQPGRGLDLDAAAFVHQQLRAVCERGGAVLLLSTDLDELLTHCDRITVLSQGKIAGELPRNAFDVNLLGQWMTGIY